MRTLMLACLSMLVLAGCTVQEDPALDAETYTLTMMDAEEGGHGLNFTLDIQGELDGMSDHIGGHYWAAMTTEPTVAGSDGGCAHVPGGGDLPGTFAVTCDLAEGTWYVRGHLRITEGEETFNFWTDAREVVVGAMQ